MDLDLKKELAAIQRLAEAASVTDRARQAVAWSLNKMPLLYEQLMKTYESRYVDEIVRHVTGMRRALARDGAPEVAEAIAARLTAMHARRGFPGLGLKFVPPAPAKRPKQKAK